MCTFNFSSKLDDLRCTVALDVLFKVFDSVFKYCQHNQVYLHILHYETRLRIYEFLYSHK